VQFACWTAFPSRASLVRIRAASSCTSRMSRPRTAVTHLVQAVGPVGAVRLSDSRWRKICAQIKESGTDRAAISRPTTPGVCARRSPITVSRTGRGHRAPRAKFTKSSPRVRTRFLTERRTRFCTPSDWGVRKRTSGDRATRRLAPVAQSVADRRRDRVRRSGPTQPRRQ